MHSPSMILQTKITLKDAQELHALIDEHGKQFRLTKGQLDESWLMI